MSVTDDLRRRVSGKSGAELWRSLEELAGTSGFRDLISREFPDDASVLEEGVTRRRFLKGIAATLALAGIAGCRATPNPLMLPYTRQPEELVPGRPLSFATALPFMGQGLGVLVKSHMGRPIKIEGNPTHPASLGATSAFAQASILSLYDPDRSTVVLERGRIQPWGAFVSAARARVAEINTRRGDGLHLLTGHVTSPTLLAQIAELQERWPLAQWHRYELGWHQAAHAGTELVFGRPLDTCYRFDLADVIVTLDADLFDGTPSSVRYAHDFAARRRVRSGSTEMSRLYAIEGSPTRTGVTADHRLPLTPIQVDVFARALAARLGVPGARNEGTLPAQAGGVDVARFVAAVADDLASHAGRSIVIAGEYQTPAVHALAQLINARLGNTGDTLVHIDPVGAPPVDELSSLRSLCQALAGGIVHTLVILGGNPAYSAPADLEFGKLLARAPFSVHLSLFADETSNGTTWHVPQAHDLETWSDVRTFDGTASIMQPLIAPLYEGRTAHDLLSVFSSTGPSSSSSPSQQTLDLVRSTWQRAFAADSRLRGAIEDGTPVRAIGDRAPITDPFERFWRSALHQGIVPGTASPAVSATPQSAAVDSLGPPPAASDLEIAFRPDPSIWDGRFSQNAWLQELPKPITKLTWDNALLMAPALAAQMNLAQEQIVEIQVGSRSISAPVFILPGHAAGCVSLHLGYGRLTSDPDADTGIDANRLRSSDAPWAAADVTLRPTARTYSLATTQNHHLMHGRDFVRAGTLELFLRDPAYAQHRHHTPPRTLTLYEPWPADGEQWGMSIDTTVCTSCNACVTACQAENNIPTVGKEGVLREREMHWLRIDHYFQGAVENPRSFFQPMLCQHCEKAPCEVVCPVAATTHSRDGLNQMVYNRCVGTRYCSNNCPYKVRRFNFFDYTPSDDQPTLRMLMNPDVTVRARGVMEKCTYCVQRINGARAEAQRSGQPLQDGDVVTACQAACPTRAIVFGNINDPASEVTRLKAEPHNFQLLGELNVQPRTTYLAALRNLNPVLEEQVDDPEGDRS